MNLLLITDSLLHDFGRADYVRGLAGALARSGHTVSVHAELGDARDLPGEVRIVDGASLSEAAARADAVHLHLPAGAGTLAAVANHRALIVHPHDYSFMCPSGSLYLKESGRLCHRSTGPLCYLWALEENCAPRNPSAFGHAYSRSRSPGALLKTDCTWTVSSAAVQKQLESLKVPAGRIHLTGYAVTAPHFTPEATPAVQSPASPKVFFAGPLTEQQGIFDLLDVAIVNEVEITVAGEGPDAGKLREAVQHAGLNGRVVIRGNLTRAERAREYAAASLVVLPSRWAEPASWAGAEAAACGKAVVAYDTGSTGGWVKHQETALLAERCYVHELSGAARVLLSSPEKLRDMGAAARRHFEQNLTWDVHVKNVIAAYEAVIAGR